MQRYVQDPRLSLHPNQRMATYALLDVRDMESGYILVLVLAMDIVETYAAF